MGPSNWQTFENPAGNVLSLFQLSDGRVVSSGRHTLKVWDLQTGSCVQTLEFASTHGIWSVVELSDGRLVSASLDNTLKVWDLQTGLCVQTIEAHTGGVSSAIQLSDGRIVSSGNGVLKVWVY